MHKSTLSIDIFLNTWYNVYRRNWIFKPSEVDARVKSGGIIGIYMIREMDMGLIADYLEEYREMHSDDPCLYIAESKVSHIRKSLDNYRQVQATPSKERIRAELLEQYHFMDEIRHKNVLREKAIRYLLAHYKLESSISINVLDALLKSIDNARTSANILIHEITTEIEVDTTVEHTSSLENEENTMIDYVLFSLYRYMTNNQSIESGEFRCLVYDCATFILIRRPDINTRSKKIIFKDYISQTSGLIVSKSRCTNCGHHLFHEFHNCLNCYERID